MSADREDQTPTLQTLFSFERDTLHAALISAKTLKEACDAYDRSLCRVNDAFIEKLPIPAARKAHTLLGLLRFWSEVWLACSKVEFEFAPKRANSKAATNARLKNVKLVIMLGLLILSVWLIGPYSPVAICVIAIVMALLGAELFGMLYAAFNRKANVRTLLYDLCGIDQSQQERPDGSDVEHAVCMRPNIDASSICNSLFNAYGEIDRFMEESDKTSDKPPTGGLVDFAEALDVLQKLASAAHLNDADRSLSYAKEVRSALLSAGLRVHVNSSEVSRDGFDYEPAVVSSITTAFTELVAISQAGLIVRRGRIIEAYCK
jgi:hypothetical protein